MRQILAEVLTTCLLISCNNNGTGPATRAVNLVAEDVSSTDAWLRVLVNEGKPYNTLRLTNLGESILTTPYVGPDTDINTGGFLPKHSYSFKAYVSLDSTAQDSSDVLTITTLDTTSQDFTWMVDTLGDGASSILHDVAIINDTLVCAVGDLYIRDSSGQFTAQPFGVAVWNGKKWQLERVVAQTQQGFDENIRPLTGIFAFSPSDIWLADGNAYHWDGKSERLAPYWIGGYPGNPNPVLGANQGVSRIWGTPSQSLYGVGVNGGAARFDGNSWTNLESGTSADIQDIWGVSRNNSVDILCAVSNLYTSGDHKILSINADGTVGTVLPDNLYAISTVWFTTQKRIFVGGGTLLEGESSWWDVILSLPPYFSNRIRGTGANDVFVVGAFGLCGHFNGVSWKSYPEVALPDGSYEGLCVTQKMVVAVGYSRARAIVLRGYRR